MKRTGLWAFAAVSLSALSILRQSKVLKYFQTTAEVSEKAPGTATAELAETVHRDRNTATATTTTTARTRAGDVFLPGSLNLTRHESYSKCYVDPIRYEHHFDTIAANWGPKQYGLLYAPIPKSGSSNSRVKLKTAFGKDGEQRYPCDKKPSKSVQLFTFVREPVSRFVSCFQEMMKRWRLNRNDKERPPNELYKRFWIKHRHVDLQKDHDGLLEALEQFLEIYDAYQLPNPHLQTQITRILRPNCIRVDTIFDLEDLESVFGGFLSELGIQDDTNSDPYTKKLHLNMSRVSLGAKRKMCQMSAIDYCCLNFELPPECKGAVSCQWVEVTHEEKAALTYESTAARRIREETTQQGSSNDTVLMIEPVSPYPKLPVQN